MKKKISLFFVLLVLCFGMAAPAFAADGAEDTNGFAGVYYRLQDGSSILTEKERRELQTLLDEVSEQLKFDVTVATVGNLDGYTAQEYADNLYEYCEFGYGSNKDGVLLLIAVSDREWSISTCGYGITAFTDEGIAYIGERMSDALSEGNYAEACGIFIRLGRQFVVQARDGDPFDKSDLPREPLSEAWIVISLAVGFAAAKLIVGSMKRRLTTVRAQTAAGSYVREGSMNLTGSSDVFLYNQLDRREKPKNNGSGSSTHTSASGTRHGGGSGKF